MSSSVVQHPVLWLIASLLAGMTVEWVLEIFYFRQRLFDAEARARRRGEELDSERFHHGRTQAELKARAAELDTAQKGRTLAESLLTAARGKLASAESELTATAAERLRLTSHDCLRLGIIDHTVQEPGEGAHTDHAETALILKRAVLRELARTQRLRPKRRIDQRYSRYRNIGSTRSWIRGRLERRLAHFTDRIGGFADRVRDRSSMRRRYEFGDDPDIPV